MSVVKMARLRLVCLKSERVRVLDVLTKRHSFEPRKADAIADLPRVGDTEHLAHLRSKQAQVAFALDFLKGERNEYEKYKALLGEREIDEDVAKIAFAKQSSARKIIAYEDFYDVSAKEYDLLSVCDALKNLSFKIVEENARLNSVIARQKQIEPFKDLEIDTHLLGDHRDVTVLAAVASASCKTQGLCDDLNVAIEVVTGERKLLTAVCLKSDKHAFIKRLSERGFTLCPLTGGKAADLLAALRDDEKAIQEALYRLHINALSYVKSEDDLRTLYDVFNLDIERGEAEREFLKTDETVLIEGWLPDIAKEQVKKEIEEVTKGVYIEYLQPKEEDEPPTLVANPRIFQPFESITNMYSAPRYREVDPNIVMSIFFFIFFGIMIGDAGYGFVLTAVGLFLGCRLKFEKGSKDMMLLIGTCGVSAIIWGVLFGGYFAIDFGDSQIALWFNPIDNPMNMLVLSIVLGCLQLGAGYVIRGIKLVQAGKPFSAIFDSGLYILLFIALGCLGLSFVVKGEAASSLQLAAIIIALCAVAGIALTAGRANKGIGGKLAGGVSGLYGLVNLFSDVLSYLRLFGLGLASCAIGLAFNTLGTMMFDLPVVGYVVGVVLLIPLHAFNLGVGVLGAYVHNARLQFLEFYGKFYDGEGRLFMPLGERTKYVRFQ